MMRSLFTLTALLCGALLAGCGSSDRDEGVGGVSASEAQALNEAAEMLDSRRIGAERALQKNMSSAGAPGKVSQP
jgi:hypothetical protein